MADNISQERFSEARGRFIQTAMLLSAFSVAAAAASRIPTWEIQAPGGWLAGAVNVGFLPVAGPVLIVFGYSYLFLTWRAMVFSAVIPSAAAKTEMSILDTEFASPVRRIADLPTMSALVVFRVWCFGVPIVAYVILLATYFNFCAPSADPEEQERLCTATRRTLTLTVGTDGWTGFKPHVASIQDNLRIRAASLSGNERARLLSLAESAPWIYPPWQTWLYAAGLAFIVYLGSALATGSASTHGRKPMTRPRTEPPKRDL